MTEEIKKCPFCGCSAFIKTYGTHGWWEVGCNSDYDDDCVKPMADGFLLKEDALTAWNKRI